MSAARHAPLGADAPVFDTQFDPVELIGTRIPFIDPFALDANDFRTSSYMPDYACSAASHSTAWPAA